jgi:aspartate aminotransferase-like enzyme
VYYDLEDQLATNPSGNVPYTPSIPLLYGLRETLGLIKAEGIDNVIARHHRLHSALSQDHESVPYSNSIKVLLTQKAQEMLHHLNGCPSQGF